MIGRITGILAAKQPPQVLVDVGGVGYEIDVPMSTFYNLPAIGEKISLLTHLAIREDAHLLYGFGSDIERTAFRELLKVSGIGAKTALSVLSGLSVNDLSVVSRSLYPNAEVSGPASVSDDVRQALLALGYNERETTETMRRLPADLAVSDAIRQALKLLGKA